MAKSKLPPGPKGAFLLGNLKAFKQDMMGFLADCESKYGAMCWFTVGPLKVCLLSDPELIKEILQTRADEVIKPWGLQQLKVALGDGLITSEGTYWRKQRKLIQQAFQPKRLKQYGDVMVKRGKERLALWQDGECRDLHMDSMKTTLAIVAESLFGMDFTKEAEHTIQTALDHFQVRFERMLIDTIPIPLNWPTPTNIRLKKEVREVQSIIQGFIDQRKQNIGDDSDLLGWLVANQPETGISDQEIIDETLTMLMAGHETTGSTLSVALYLVAKHPEVEERFLREMDEVLGDSEPTADDFDSLVYTQCIVQETMRMYPAAWAMSRESIKPMELGGYHFPKRTQFMIAQSVMHKLKSYYPEPEKFKPERWLANQKRTDLPKYAFLPFGGGARFCIGSTFATMEATLLFAIWMKKFRCQIPEGFNLDMQPSITLRPRHGLDLIVSERDTQSAPTTIAKAEVA